MSARPSPARRAGAGALAGALGATAAAQVLLLGGGAAASVATGVAAACAFLALARWADAATFLVIAALGGLAMLTMHPQIIGRPGRIRMLESFLAWALEQPGVGIGTAGEVAARVRA